MLPKLLAPERRRLMLLLVANGLGQAALAGAGAFLMTWLLGAPDAGTRIAAIAALVAAAHGVGGLRLLERVLAEKLGQHYINEIRTGLVRSALVAETGPSLGITIARTTNDLSSVRNWIALGIAPLTVGVPLILGSGAALWFLAPALSAALLLPLCLLAVALCLFAGPAFAKARILRRRRGRLAAQIADTVAASVTIRAAGGDRRELRQVERLGGKVAAAAVERARIAGFIRASAVVTASVTATAVAGSGAWLGIDAATIAAALTVVGVIAAPVNDLGRVVEYRQNFKAARRILGPALAAGASSRRQQDAGPEQEARRREGTGGGTGAEGMGPEVAGPERETGPEGGTGSGLLIEGLVLDGAALPPLAAAPGARIVLGTPDSGTATRLFEMILGVRAPEVPGARICLGRHDLLAVPSSKRRVLVGYAARGGGLERGTIARAVRYRRPDLDERQALPALAAVGLADRVSTLPDAERTVLKRGGEPLSASERARLQLARAAFGEPALLLVNHLEEDLDADGRARLAEVLRGYPGTVVLASAQPQSLVDRFEVWGPA
jgi:ABC-type multidrug transport system fused ATPase/permease subunit